MDFNQDVSIIIAGDAEQAETYAKANDLDNYVYADSPERIAGYCCVGGRKINVFRVGTYKDRSDISAIEAVADSYLEYNL